MNKAELVQTVQKRLGSAASLSMAERAVTAVLSAIECGLKNDQVVQLVGFGTFRVVERKARRGVNPQTLEPMTIPESKTIRFVPGKNFGMEGQN